jgi:hypothetical protein
MFERSIGRAEVLAAVAAGEVIARYPEDEPYPSVLLSAPIQGRTLHVVVAEDVSSHICYIVTVYIPDPALWNSGFKTRKPS